MSTRKPLVWHYGITARINGIDKSTRHGYGVIKYAKNGDHKAQYMACAYQNGFQSIAGRKSNLHEIYRLAPHF